MLQFLLSLSGLVMVQTATTETQRTIGGVILAVGLSEGLRKLDQPH